MARIIDLTHPITSGMPVFPGDPEVKFARVSTIKESGYHVTAVKMGTHSGTHVDVPSHVLYDDHAVDSLSMDDLVGWAEVLDLGELKPKAEITAADLDVFSDRVPEHSRILLRTGWGKRFGDPEFFTEAPGLSEGAAMWLIARKVRLVGLEQPSVHTEEHLVVHKSLLSERIVIIETIANMHLLRQNQVYLVALPLKLVGLDGAPMRVIAIEDADVSA